MYAKRIFDNYDNAEEVFKDYLLIERPRPNLKELNVDYNFSHWFFSKRWFEK